jgi:Rhodopirellula transposase DDE domain
VLEQLLADETAGDPCRSLKWKHKRLARLSAALGDAHPASPPTVARLLELLDYSRKVNHKTWALSSPHRNEQFEDLRAQKQAFFEQGSPVIYVDSKKRELIGLFKNAGTIGCRDPHRVNVYDFRSLADGIAIPYGIYDPHSNEGFVYVGTSSDTAEFAVDAIVWWWQTYGQRHYPHATELLILADGGGSNGYRPRLWKYTLQHRLVNPTGLTVTVCHYPTGASKWNWVEHRLFSPVSGNWAGEPLDSYATMLGFLNATTTEQGLIVRAVLTKTKYQTKIKISDQQMAALNLTKHETLPQWNYTIHPNHN